MELSIKEVEVAKLSLKPGEVLVIKLKTEEADQVSMNNLAEGFRGIFPNNKVVVMNMGESGDVDFAKIASEIPQALSCSSSPLGYCGDCNCGKREQIEGAK